MSKVVKLTQSDIEKIVTNIVSEQIDETILGTDQEQEVDEDFGGGDLDVYPAKDSQGNMFLVNAKTGEIVAKD